MTAKAKRPPITAAKFLSMSGTEGYELVDGRLKEKAMGVESSWIQTRLANRVGNYVEADQLGQVFGGDCMYRCFAHKPEQVRKPDFSFAASDKFPGGVIPVGPLELSPDWIAEVVSPKERVNELNDKVEDFLAAGVPLIWVIYPRSRTVTVHTGRRSTTLTAADEITAAPVLPGFRVRVGDLFPPAPPPAS
jgi:Uma2 family endonuclease